MKNYLSILPIALVLSLFSAPAAHAIRVSVEGGGSMTSGAAFDAFSSSGTQAAGSVSISLFPLLDLGAFYKGAQYSVENERDAKLGTSFYGISLKTKIPFVFVEARAGKFKFDQGLAGEKLAYGAVIGKDLFSLGFAKLALIASYQTAPYKNENTGAEASGTLLDYGLRLSVGF
jgi:hypothetical protein